MVADERFANPAGISKEAFFAAFAIRRWGGRGHLGGGAQSLRVHAELKVSFLARSRSHRLVLPCAGGRRGGAGGFVEASVTTADGIWSGALVDLSVQRSP